MRREMKVHVVMGEGSMVNYVHAISKPVNSYSLAGTAVISGITAQREEDV